MLALDIAGKAKGEDQVLDGHAARLRLRPHRAAEMAAENLAII